MITGNLYKKLLLIRLKGFIGKMNVPAFSFPTADHLDKGMPLFF